jgi:hypothetical protein
MLVVVLERALIIPATREEATSSPRPAVHRWRQSQRLIFRPARFDLPDGHDDSHWSQWTSLSGLPFSRASTQSTNLMPFTSIS